MQDIKEKQVKKLDVFDLLQKVAAEKTLPRLIKGLSR